MNQGAVLHKGLLAECKVCDSTTKTQQKRERKARGKTSVSLDVVIRRQVAFDLGEDEPQKDERFQLLQKYGVAAPRIDRLMTKPNWMGVAEWKRKLNDWYKSTKGLVVPQQRRTFQPRPSSPVDPRSQKTSKPWREIQFKNPQAQQRHQQRNQTQQPRPRDTRAFRPNSGQTKTATLQS